MNTPESYYLGALNRALSGDLEGAVSLQERAEEAREAYGYSFSEAVSDDFPFVEEAVTTLLSSYDFTRCVRPDGSVYGTRGKCRKGTETAKEAERKVDKRPRTIKGPGKFHLVEKSRKVKKGVYDDPESPTFHGEPWSNTKIKYEIKYNSSGKTVGHIESSINKGGMMSSRPRNILELADGRTFNLPNGNPLEGLNKFLYKPRKKPVLGES